MDLSTGSILAIVGLIIGFLFFLILLIYFGHLTKRVYERIEKSEKELNVKIDGIESIKQSIADTQKAIILAQDKSAASKQALVDLLVNKQPELKEVAAPVKEEIKAEEEKRKEVLGKVKKDYIPVD